MCASYALVKSSSTNVSENHKNLSSMTNIQDLEPWYLVYLSLSRKKNLFMDKYKYINIHVPYV